MARRSVSESNVICVSPVNFHHNGERWVSQDKNWEAKAELLFMVILFEGESAILFFFMRWRADLHSYTARKAQLKPLYIISQIRYYYTKIAWNPPLPAPRRARVLYVHCSPHLALPFCWQRSSLHCLRVDW